MRYTPPPLPTTTYLARLALLALFLSCLSKAALAQETLPALRGNDSTESANESGQPGSEASKSPDSAQCPKMTDAPLSSLTVDVSPRDAKGNHVSPEDRPQGCWFQDGKTRRPIFLEAEYVGCDLGCCELLKLARFCHPPVYFEDEPFERCGQCVVCPALHSAARLSCDLVLLPAKLLVLKPSSCVRTPTPHCCSPLICGKQSCNVCGP